MTQGNRWRAVGLQQLLRFAGSELNGHDGSACSEIFYLILERQTRKTDEKVKDAT